MGPGMSGRMTELVLAGLVADEDELLGDLVEERAYREQTDGPRAARRWYRRQAVLAVPRLIWDAVVAGPARLLLAIAAGALVTAALPAGVLVVELARGIGLAGFAPTYESVVRQTALVVGLALVGAVLGSTAAAVVARHARLVPAIVLAVLWVPLAIAAASPFGGEPGSTAVLSAGPHLWLLPVWWVTPTLMVAMPLLTLVGGLAAVARSPGDGPGLTARGRLSRGRLSRGRLSRAGAPRDHRLLGTGPVARAATRNEVDGPVRRWSTPPVDHVTGPSCGFGRRFWPTCPSCSACTGRRRCPIPEMRRGCWPDPSSWRSTATASPPAAPGSRRRRPRARVPSSGSRP